MKIKQLIKELQKELNRGDEEIYLVFYEGKTAYDFDLGIDDNGQALIVANKYPEHYNY
jgi:hypothetical protein